MFINTKGKNKGDFSQEFLDFMEYITSSTDNAAENTESMRIKQIHATVRKIRISERMGVKYMQRWEEIAYARQDGKIEGQSEGEVIKLIKQICKKMEKNKTLEEIAEDLEEEPAAILPIYESARQFAPAYDYKKVLEAGYISGSGQAD